MNKEESVLSKDFPKKLRQLREGRGWSQGQLAKKIGADVNRVSKYERGVIWPTLEFIVRMALIFEVSVDYLVRETDNVPLDKIEHPDLFRQFEKVSHLPETDIKTVLSIMDAVVKRHHHQSIAQS